MSLLIENALLVRPGEAPQANARLLIDGKTLAATGEFEAPADAERIDARGLVATPGLIDAGVFRSDAAACLAGGITRVLLMPDQSPPLDDPALVERAMRIGKPHVWVHPLAAATKGLGGRELAEIGLMRDAGAVAVATGRTAISDAATMYRLLQYAAGFGLTVVTHAEDSSLAGDSSVTSGQTATRLGLPAAPAVAEPLAVARDVRLAEAAGAKLHIRTVSMAESIEIIDRAKRRGVQLTCGTTPAHALLSDRELTGYRTFTKLSPPLRCEEDRTAVVDALRAGTIDIVCSAHDPRTQEDKRLPFADAAPGMAGLETLLPLTLMALGDEPDLARAAALLSGNPARIFGLPGGKLEAAAPADLVLFDPGASWRVDASAFDHAAGNTPFDRLPVSGRVEMTIKGGEIVYRRNS
nr:dihydroorotase [Pacificimonas aurantium]